jgi:hypothetical protein
LTGDVAPEDMYSKDVVDLVERRLIEEAKYEQYR